MRSTTFFLIAAALATPLTVLAAGSQQLIQCWTDNKGQRMCGDHVPPEYANKKREVLNDRGQIVETKKGARTPEEIAEDARKAKAAEDAKKREAYDRSLLETYRSVKDLESMRDERLDFIDGRVNAAKKSLADTKKTLTDLRERADAQLNDKKKGKVDDRLAKQIKEFERSEKRSERSLEKFQKERDDTQANFDRDIARFRELRGEPAPPAKPPAAAPASAETPKPAPATNAAEPAKVPEPAKK